MRKGNVASSILGSLLMYGGALVFLGLLFIIITTGGFLLFFFFVPMTIAFIAFVIGLALVYSAQKKAVWVDEDRFRRE